MARPSHDWTIMQQKIVLTFIPLLSLLLGGCQFLCIECTYPPYGTFLASYCYPNIDTQCLTVDLGKLEQPSQYRVVMTTQEYPDNAPPYAGATNIVPLSQDYEFLKPSLNAQRDPLIIQPNQFNVVLEIKAIKVKPVAPLYFYLVKVSGSGFVPAGQAHITAYAEPYK
jgi:hypothetical protein